MKKIKNYIKEKKNIIFVFVIVVFVLSLPLMQYKISIADDHLFHFSRIQSITDCLKNGVFPVKVHTNMANSCGYGAGLFYPNLFLYIPAVINLFISNVAVSYKIFTVIILAALFLLSYISIKAVTKDTKTALLGTILIMFSKGLIHNLYDRTALGELIGFIFITPIICGLYNYVHDDFDKPYLIAIGFLGVANSHLITTLICIIFSILYFLINIKSSIKNPKKFLKLLLTAIVVILLSTAFWLPMLEQLSVQEFKLSHPWTSIKDEEYYPMDLFGTGKYSIGLIVTAFMPMLIYGLLDRKVDKKVKPFIFLTIFIMFLMLCGPFWTLTNNFSNIIQFKWRLLGIITILSSICISTLIKNYVTPINIKFEHIIIVLTAICMIYTIIIMNDTIKNHNTCSPEYIETIIYGIPESIGGGQEYLPVELDYDKLQLNSYIAFLDNNQQIPVAKDGIRTTAYIEQGYKATFAEVPCIYYLGYVSNITSPEGVVTPLAVEKSENGLVKVIIPDNLYGTLNVWYDRTDLQRISYFVSLATAIVVCVGFGIYKYNKHKKASIY